ncbi:UDP-4-amino-4,6-dideoxy-N-acetyl-beta-L-altrosamine transaminase [Candidatus Riflebacteria bacterium]
MPELAIDGGNPIRKKFLSYGKQSIDEDDIKEVCRVLRSDFLTTGPKVEEFEEAFADLVNSKEAIAVSSGTAALHAAIFSLGIGKGDEVIVPALTFAASANCVVYQGGKPVFCDVDRETLLINPRDAEKKITSKTKAILSVDFAGQPCDYKSLKKIAAPNNLKIVADACHSLGANYMEKKVGSITDLSAFSLHPVKGITTGEGGMVTCSNKSTARKMRAFRNHGITVDYRTRAEKDSWFYKINEPGYNYRLTDFQCALGLSQLKKLPGWIKNRNAVARFYDNSFKDFPWIAPLKRCQNGTHAFHLYIVRLDLKKLKVKRKKIFQALRAEGIGVNVHYIPVHLHPFYQKNFKTREGLCPEAETAYKEILTLPIFPGMTKKDSEDVKDALYKVLNYYGRG